MKYFFSKDNLISISLILVGTFIYSYAINGVIIPNNLGTGGITGVSVLFFYLFGWNTGIVNFIINAFLLIIGYRFLEKRTMLYTVFAIITISFFLEAITDRYAFVANSPLIAAITAGCLSGVGIGLVMLGNGTTAGTDIIAMLLKKYFHWKVAVSLLVMDIITVAPFAVKVGLENTILSLIMMFLFSQILNFILEGFNPKKSIMIISNQYDAIGKEIQAKMDRGITILDGSGFYSKEEKKVLYLVVNRLQLMPIQRIIHEFDPTAFVIITDVKQVIGEGFSFYLDHNE